jgi:glycosyltransferase involved in cell wall biosynthesis
MRMARGKLVAHGARHKYICRVRALVISPDAVDPALRGRLRALQGMGCSVTLVVPANWPPDSAAPDWGNDGGIRIAPVPVKGSVDPATLRWQGGGLFRLLAEIRPDIVHVDGEPWWPLTARALRLAAKLRIPAVIHASTSVPVQISLPARLRRRRSLRSARGLMGINRMALEAMTRDRTGVPSAVAPRHGIASLALGRPRHPRPHFMMGFIGRLVPERGLDILIRAAARLRGDWGLTVVGTGPSQPELEALAERVGIGSRVRWLGGMPRNWLESVWPTLDCVVLPARTTAHWVEPVGQALLDAMAQGLPVIGTDSGVIPEVIGDAGIVVPEDDADTLGLALERLQRMPDEQARLGAAGRKRVLTEFADDAVARKTLTFWREVAAWDAAPTP